MGLPATIIETERLLLTTFTADDAVAIVAINNVPEVSANTVTLPYPYTAEDAIGFMQRFEGGDGREREACYAIRRRGDRALIGSIGIVPTPSHRRAELGYIIGREYRGVGYATEACAGVLGRCFTTLDLHKVTAAWYSDNPASGRILEKLGFANEGTVREQFFRGGRWRDSVTMGLLRRDYEQQQQESAQAGETTT